MLSNYKTAYYEAKMHNEQRKYNYRIMKERSVFFVYLTNEVSPESQGKKKKRIHRSGTETETETLEKQRQIKNRD